MLYRTGTWKVHWTWTLALCVKYTVRWATNPESQNNIQSTETCDTHVHTEKPGSMNIRARLWVSVTTVLLFLMWVFLCLFKIKHCLLYSLGNLLPMLGGFVCVHAHAHICHPTSYVEQQCLCFPMQILFQVNLVLLHELIHSVLTAKDVFRARVCFIATELLQYICVDCGN